MDGRVREGTAEDDAAVRRGGDVVWLGRVRSEGVSGQGELPADADELAHDIGDGGDPAVGVDAGDQPVSISRVGREECPAGLRCNREGAGPRACRDDPRSVDDPHDAPI